MQSGSCRRVKGTGRADDPSGVVWLDALLLVVLVVLTLLGAWRGALESGLRLAGWVGGYAAAFFAAPRAGRAVAALLGAPEWLGMPVTGILVFLAVQIAVAIAIVFVRRRRAEEEPSSADRLLGGAFGAARGALLVVLVGWLALFADAYLSRTAAQADATPLAHSRAARWSGAAIEQGAGALVGDDNAAARAAVAFAAHPREAFGALEDLVGDPRVVALQRDAGFWSRLDAGEIDAALARPSARALVGDAAFRSRLAALGLVDERASRDPLAFEIVLYDALAAAAPRIRALRHDPELAALLEDPELQELARSGDVLGLLAHPQLRSVLERAAGS